MISSLHLVFGIAEIPSGVAAHAEVILLERSTTVLHAVEKAQTEAASRQRIAVVGNRSQRGSADSS